ncbi:2-oxo acid dehydrogenase subunit E2 [Nocardia sp. R7R-8]|uniref:2-oxo acid dehydrogenase subunit E2 n=1 Tax=Nocardia sp. R7R-8 TaxID=3459304 RepID=UPI00403D5BDA
MYVVKLPRLGQTMESGIITSWHLDEGDEFAEGDPLYEVETDKMTSEVEAKQSGVLAKILVPTDENVPVGTVLALAAEPGETVSDDDIRKFIGDQDSNGTTAREDPSATVPGESQAISAPAQAPVPSGAVRAVPKARHLAKQAGIDLTSVRGTGVDGTIRVADLPRAHANDAEPRYVGPPRVAERIPLRGVAKSMAEAVTRSWREIPQFVQQTNLDATALRARLERLRYEGVQVTITDLVIGAVAHAAADVPEVNATFSDEEIIRYSDVNVSFAVASDRGLVVPVVRQANTLPIAEVSRRTKELAGKAKAGKLTTEDAGDGTITVSNLGVFGIDTGTPLVNAPQSAIVFVGSLRDEAVVVDGRIVVQPRMNIAVAFDHRVVDGMTGAQFTSTLKGRLEAGG